MFGSASDWGAPALSTANGTLKFEPQGTGFVDFEGIPATRFVYSRVRVTNTGTATVDHLTLLPVTTLSQDGSVSGTVGGTAFSGLTNQDGSDASGRAAELVTGQAGIPDPYPVTVRPDADASLYVQDLDLTDLAAQAPSGLKIDQIQPKGWRLASPLAPGQSAVMTLGTSIPLVQGSALPSSYTISVVAINDPSPKIEPFNVKLDLSQSVNSGYQFPYWQPSGEAVYMFPLSGSSGLRMVTLARVQNDATASFNLPGRTVVAPFLSPAFGDPAPDCTVIDEKISDRAAQSMDAGFTLAEDFTVFRGLDLVMRPQAEQTSTQRSAMHPVYYDRDVTGMSEYQCQTGTMTTHYKANYNVKAGWNLSHFTRVSATAADGSVTREATFDVQPLTDTQVWTLNPSGQGGAQPPRF